MKIEILYNFITQGQRKNQNDVRIELNTRHTYFFSMKIRQIYYISFYDL